MVWFDFWNVDSCYPILLFVFHAISISLISDGDYPCVHYFCPETHYDSTMGNVNARNVLCDVTMSNDVAMCMYHAIIMDNVAMSLFYM